MTKRGGLLIPFALILSMFALLLGTLTGNIIGRKNQIEKKVGPLDVYAPAAPDLQTQR